LFHCRVPPPFDVRWTVSERAEKHNASWLDSFTGRIDNDVAMDEGLIDKEFFTDRPVGYLDPGSVYSVSGHVGVWDGDTYTMHTRVRVSTRYLYRACHIDRRERAGAAAWKESGRTGLARNNWEQRERASPGVIPERPTVDEWMSDVDYTRTRDAVKARGQAKGMHAKRRLKFQLLDTLNASFRELGAATGKRPVLVVGSEGKSNRGVRGARGSFSRELIEFLAEFFLVLELDEYNTSKLTPCCHRESQFANDHELRSKRCPHCTVTYDVKKPVAAGEATTRTISFCYDRDLGASVNFAYIAIFMAATGKRPSAFAPSSTHWPVNGASASRQ
jgi:hypothetical protein